jgi:fructosamine-3-kinase
MTKLYNLVETALGVRPEHAQPLTGGMIGEVYRVNLPGEEAIVAKVANFPGARLNIEGFMLRYLAEKSSLPIPRVLYDDESLLLMQFVEGSSHFNASALRHAAELLAELHSVQGPAFGLERDTLIGSLDQYNPWTESWLEFFRDQRLLHMAHEAARAGELPASYVSRVERMAAHLDKWLEEPEFPALIHGDVWSTNLLAAGGRITAFLDPAIYYAHPEIELAYTLLFNGFDPVFIERYQEIRVIAPGFMEVRRDIYNLYPLLVHVRIFGGGYVQSVDQTLRRFGF